MIRLRDLLSIAYAPLARRHMLVDGCVTCVLHRMLTGRRGTAHVAPVRANARVVRLFAVQIR